MKCFCCFVLFSAAPPAPESLKPVRALAELAVQKAEKPNVSINDRCANGHNANGHNANGHNANRHDANGPYEALPSGRMHSWTPSINQSN